MAENMLARVTRRLPIGAEPVANGVSFRVWAPSRETVEVVVEGSGTVPLAAETDGYFSGVAARATPGSLYRFRLDDDATLYPDPASRFQPDGPHGPSQVVDPTTFAWSDRKWRGVTLKGQVILEVHLGSFTPAGTWAAAIEKLPLLAETGITLLELLPVGDFPGRFGWGYDGVNLFAPSRLYGGPDEFRRFVDAAHTVGIGVILDVVYNHFGPDGNYIGCFTRDYFTDRYECEWGEAINFDGGKSAPVREFMVSNAEHWISEYHLDGLRLDATQALFDESDRHIITEIVETTRAAAGEREIIVIGESEPQRSHLLRPASRCGCGLDAAWADDFHHSAMVAMTGRREAYYSDHTGSPQEFVSAAKYGYLFQGQYYAWQKKGRGTPAFDLPLERFVNYLQNHDQIANSGRGLRFHLLTSPGRARAMTALLLLMPTTPLLFQGQEFWSSSPWHYFSDHKEELARSIRRGRAEFVSQFPSLAGEAMQKALVDPASEETFRATKLDWRERDRNDAALRLHRDLLRLRREDPVFAAQDSNALDGAVLGTEVFLLRFFGAEGDDRLLVVNLGLDLSIASMAEPLLAPPEGRHWQPIWSSEHPDYGGSGVAVDIAGRWRIQGHSAMVMAPSAGTATQDLARRGRSRG
jgi:maltooligosyltrehalose trehalohydrolase